MSLCKFYITFAHTKNSFWANPQTIFHEAYCQGTKLLMLLKKLILSLEALTDSFGTTFQDFLYKEQLLFHKNHDNLSP